jgi:hypothetical protein
MSVTVPKCTRAAKEADAKVATVKVKLLDNVILPDPDVKHGTEVLGPADSPVEVLEAYGERFVRVGVAEKV